MLAAVKPTVGRISRYGVIPITADQDTAGPMAKTVTDAAIMLGALESPSPDPNDPATKTCTPPPNRDYTRFLKADSLKGARIAVSRASSFTTTLRLLDPRRSAPTMKPHSVSVEPGAPLPQLDLPPQALPSELAEHGMEAAALRPNRPA
jgi:Amidase